MEFSQTSALEQMLLTATHKRKRILYIFLEKSREIRYFLFTERRESKILTPSVDPVKM